MCRVDQLKTMSFKSQIQQNARVIAKLHQRIQETFAYRDDNDQSRLLWKDACSEFPNKYNELAFPGGISDIRHRLRAGDEEAIEYALDFIEVRPYFFRSGYMYKDFLRVLKNCPLSDGQRKRYDRVRSQYDEYRDQRRSSQKDKAR